MGAIWEGTKDLALAGGLASAPAAIGVAAGAAITSPLWGPVVAGAGLVAGGVILGDEILNQISGNTKRARLQQANLLGMLNDARDEATFIGQERSERDLAPFLAGLQAQQEHPPIQPFTASSAPHALELQEMVSMHAPELHRASTFKGPTTSEMIAMLGARGL